MFRSRIARAAIAGVFLASVSLWASGASVASADTGHSASGQFDGSGQHDPHQGGFDHHDHQPSTVYTETNASAANAVLAYEQRPDGTTTARGRSRLTGTAPGRRSGRRARSRSATISRSWPRSTQARTASPRSPSTTTVLSN